MALFSRTPATEAMSQSWTLLTAVSASSALAFLGVNSTFIAWLFIGALATMTLEIITEWGSKKRRKDREFNLGRNVGGKLMVLVLVPVGFILDRLLISLAPEHLEASMISWMWVTKSVLLWIILGEIVCTIKHIEHSEGENAIPPVVRWVIRQIRVMDQKRWQGPEGERPPRRWYDDLTEEDIADLMKKMEERRSEGKPTEYIAQHPKEAIEEGREYPQDKGLDTMGERGEV